MRYRRISCYNTRSSRRATKTGFELGVEVIRAQGWLLGAVWQRSLELATDASRTFAVEAVRHGGTDRLMNWPDAVRAVTATDVKRVAQDYLDPADFTTVAAGPLAEIRAARHPRWPVSLDDLEVELLGGR